MKQFFKLLSVILLVTVTQQLRAQVSGTVFRDYNGNGVKDNTASFNEPFVQGVTVKATLVNGNSFTATTNAAGAYSFTVGQIPAASAVRIEFSGFATGDYPAFKGTGNTTNVAFVTAPSTTTTASTLVLGSTTVSPAVVLRLATATRSAVSTTRGANSTWICCSAERPVMV